MKLSILVATIFLSGCVAMDVSDTGPVKDLIGTCYEFKEPGELVRTIGSDKEKAMKYTSSYLFLSAASQNHYRERKENREMTKSLEPGTKIQIVKVVDYPYGSTGRCWIVKANLLGIDTKDELVEIPSCWVWDKPIWVYPPSPYELEQASGRELSIKTPVLETSSCS